jgi:hypothetical protein
LSGTLCSAYRLNGSHPVYDVLIVSVWYGHPIASLSQVVPHLTRQYSFMSECNY